MTIDDQIRDEKLQHDFNRKSAMILALSSNKIDKYEYITGEGILPSNRQKIMEQAKFTYFPLGKALEKQTKTVEDQGEKQVKASQDLKLKEQIKSIERIFSEGYKIVEIKNEINKIEEYEKKKKKKKKNH